AVAKGHEREQTSSPPFLQRRHTEQASPSSRAQSESDARARDSLRLGRVFSLFLVVVIFSDVELRVVVLVESREIEGVVAVLLSFVFAEVERLGRLLFFVVVLSGEIHWTAFFFEAQQLGRILVP